MKKFKLTIALVLLASMFSLLILLSACDSGSNPQDIPNPTDSDVLSYNCAFETSFLSGENPFITSYFDSNDKTLIEKIDSKEALEKFCNDKALPVFDTNNEHYNDNVCKKLREYENSFFEYNSLIFLFEFEESEDYYSFDSLQLNDSALTIHLSYANATRTAKLRTVAYGIEVNKKATETVKSISINKLEAPYKLYNYYYSYLSNITIDNILVKFDTLNEINSFKENTQKPFFTDPAPYFAPCKTRLNSYDSDFFKDKSLIALFLYSSYPMFYSVNGIEIEGETAKVSLYVRQDQITDCAYPNVSGNYIYLFEIDKTEVSNVKNIVVEKTIK